MKNKAISLLLINVSTVSLLLGCSRPLDKATLVEIDKLKESVCIYTLATGRDSVNTQEWAKYFGDPKSPEVLEKFHQFNKDTEALEKLVGKWIDPATGKGWLKFCKF